MKTARTAVLRPRINFFGATLARTTLARHSSHRLRLNLALIAMGLLAAPPAQAAVIGLRLTSVQPYVVLNDRGGLIESRLAEIYYLKATGRPVEIRGRLCLSSCTMLLGLPRTCVSPKTIFGFHGPSLRGTALPAEEFEYYSRQMAQYYPKPIRTWFMQTGRLLIKGLHHIKGTEIIRMGIPACPDTGQKSMITLQRPNHHPRP